VKALHQSDPSQPFLLNVELSMRQSSALALDERIVDVMIQLARATTSHRVIVAGSNHHDMFLELFRRGYSRVTTPKTCRIPCGQFDVALVAWSEHSIKALGATLDWLVHFLSPTGTLVVWVGSHDPMPNQKLRAVLGRLGFSVESGTWCEGGVAVSARRLESIPTLKVA
jgi:hypothetical protein